MARYTPTYQEITRNGLNAIYTTVAAANGLALPADIRTTRCMLHLKNTSGSAVVVNGDIVATIDGQTVTDPTYSIPAGGHLFLSPASFTTDYALTLDFAAALDVALLSLPMPAAGTFTDLAPLGLGSRVEV